MARKHTQLAKSRLLQYTEIQATSIPAGTTVYEVATLPSTVDVSKEFIYVTETAKYYRIKPKEPGQYNASTEENGVMMGEPAVNVASGYEAIFVHKYPNTGSSTDNNGLSVYKPITESIDLNTSSMYTPTAQAVSKFVVPEYNTTVTSSTPTILLKENVAFKCTNAGVTSVTLNVSDVYGATNPKTREARVYFHTGSNPTTLSLTGTGSSSMTVIGDTSLLPDKDYAVSVKDNTVVINTESSSVLYEPVTYSQLVAKINNSQLVKGRKYRITDYVTTTTQANTSSAGHAFDLVVTAIDVNKLDHRTSALLHSGDTYFSTAGADLSKWQIWYDVNNDTNKYEWADTTNGKGVIYRIIDEWENDCPYDFKNIKFKRKLTNGVYDETNGTDTWVYTFNAWNSDDSAIEDASLITNSVLIADSSNSCYNNVMGVYRQLYDDSIPYMVLNDIVFLNTYSFEDDAYFECSSSTFGDNCYNNTFGNSCRFNTFGYDCYSNIFGDFCLSNNFGDFCHSNTFGNSCSNNTFGNRCYNNTFGDICSNNTCGNDYDNNIFGDYCRSNTFGDNCHNNIFGDFCLSNTFGNRCQCISFGNSSNQGGTYCSYNIFENGTNYIRLYNTGTESQNNQLQNVYVAQGVSGTANSYVQISTIERNLSYRTTVGRDSNGNIRIYNEDDPASASQAQADWNETDNTDPAYIKNKPDLDATLYESVTYSQLVTKINNSQLVKGRKYRITDYVTTTTQSNTSSAGHAFDLVVTAIDVNKLACEASALLHSGDTYFSTAGANLNKWQIWYDINNTTTKYVWADSTNGKGVIYRMIDEWENDCPYDFKNIMFKRRLGSDGSISGNGTITDVYTFSWFNEDSEIEDLSLVGNRLQNFDNSYTGIYGNIIGPTSAYNMEFYPGTEFAIALSGNVFISSYYYDNGVFYGCNYNRFKNDCYNNTFGNNCHNNTFGNNCDGITFGNNCHNNTFGNNCNGITFGTFCHDNTFGNDCGYISFGNSSGNYGNYVRNVIIESGCYNIRLYKDGTADWTHFLQNIYISQGIKTNSINLYIELSTIARGLSYRTTVGRDSSGNIRIYNEDDPASASQAQANWNETNSSSPSYIQNKPDLDATLYEPVTYSQLVTKINNSQLVKGKKYRITDYVTRTVQTNTSSAGHAFDLVVTATDVNKLDCIASALLHSGDTYFSTAGADLNKWQIWYDVNNDTIKYLWADSTNGKGVIYRMIDEWGNDCPYDFKNILFTKANSYTSAYTFNKFTSGDTANSDYSLNIQYRNCYENIIFEYYNVYGGVKKRNLNFNVFLTTDSTSTCYSNTFECDCYNNTFGDGCSGNTFLSMCYNNTFSDNCRYNVFGSYCNSNTFGNNCFDNSFGTDCYSNIFGNYCYTITLENRCGDIVLGNSSNQGGSYIINMTIKSGNSHVRIYNTSSPSDSNYLKDIYIAQGCSGTEDDYTEISTIARNLSYRTTVGRDSSGNIRIYNEDDPASASQAQANWNETSSSSPSYIQNKPTLTTITFRYW